MTDFQMNNHILQKECEELARWIFDEVMAENEEDEGAEYHRETMFDRAHEYADGHEWIIYTYKAHLICASCDVSQGEEFLEDVGAPNPVTYDSLGAMIAYGEMRARIEGELNDLIEKWEDDNDA